MEITMADKNSVTESNSSNGEGEGTTPEFVTKAEINSMINGFRKSFKKDLEEQLKAIATPSNEEVAVTPKKSSKEVDPEKEEMKAQLKQVLAERAQEKAELQSRKLTDTLSDILVKNGIDPKHVKPASAFLKQEKGIRYDEDGNIKMKMDFDEIDLHEAVKSWAKTDEAKLFMSPKGAVGSGQRGSVKSSPVKPGEEIQVDWTAFLRPAK
jgi:hypothetical protein